MRKSVKVSVIMGVYNGAHTVERAVKSILRQTFTDYEIILCDDASKDDTYNVLCRLKVQNPEKITVLQNADNQGLAATLNKCISVASGEWIARMDADDLSLPERFEKQVAFLETHKEFAMVGCSADKFDENGIYGTIRYAETPVKKDFLWNNPFLHPSMMLRHSVLNKVGGYNESKWCMRCEDYELWLRLYALGYCGYNMQEILFQYYEGQENLVKRKYRYRFIEAMVRWRGFYKNGMLLRGLPYVVKPLLVGLIPAKIYKKVKYK